MAKPKDAPPTTEPVITSLAIIRSEGYWQVCVLETKGDKVVSTTKIGQPSFKHDAIWRFQIEAAQRLMGES